MDRPWKKCVSLKICSPSIRLHYQHCTRTTHSVAVVGDSAAVDGGDGSAAADGGYCDVAMTAYRCDDPTGVTAVWAYLCHPAKE